MWYCWSAKGTLHRCLCSLAQARMQAMMLLLSPQCIHRTLLIVKAAVSTVPLQFFKREKEEGLGGGGGGGCSDAFAKRCDVDGGIPCCYGYRGVCVLRAVSS